MLRWLTDASLADSIAGDLEEQRRQRARSSPVAATLWYWRAYLAVAIYLMARRPVEGRSPVMRTIPSDIRDAARLFRRAPLFGAAAVLILALGTGATSAILSLADKALIRPLPIPDVSRVVQSTFSFSYLDFRDLAKEHGGFSQVAAWGYPPLAIEQAGEALQVTGAVVSGDYFALIGQQPVAGRLLNRSDDVTGAPATGVMSERLWTRVFRRDPQIVGSVLTVNRMPVAIVGISPAAFRGTSLQIAPELFVNLPSLADLSTGFMANPATLTNRGRVFLTIAARLNDGVSLDQANEEARRIYYSHRDRTTQNTSVWFAPLLTPGVGCENVGRSASVHDDSARRERGHDAADVRDGRQSAVGPVGAPPPRARRPRGARRRPRPALPVAARRKSGHRPRRRRRSRRRRRAGAQALWARSCCRGRSRFAIFNSRSMPACWRRASRSGS